MPVVMRAGATALALAAMCHAGEFASRASAQAQAPAAQPAAQPAAATREVPAGGLVFVPDAQITLERREVKIRRDQITSTYVLRNIGKEDRSFLAAFALPEIDVPSLGDQELTLPTSDDLNFVGATATQDGQPIEVNIEQRAYAFGIDISQLLADTGLPLFPFADGMGENLAQLPAELRTQFAQRGIVHLEDNRVDPFWSVRTTMHWLQTVPAGKSVTIALTYQPIMGAAPYAADDLPRLREVYCLDKGVEDTIKRKVAQKQAVSFEWQSYALTSDASQSGPAKAFRLLIEKPDAATLVATCRKGMKVLGPTTWEWSAEDFTAEEDISVLFVR